jgi:hypothetical protein
VEEAGQGCVIGGIKIEDFELGTVAHSDGDVLYHSATDALLGALGLPDIGQLFPDNDPRWRVIHIHPIPRGAPLVLPLGKLHSLPARAALIRRWGLGVSSGRGLRGIFR